MMETSEDIIIAIGKKSRVRAKLVGDEYVLTSPQFPDFEIRIPKDRAPSYDDLRYCAELEVTRHIADEAESLRDKHGFKPPKQKHRISGRSGVVDIQGHIRRRHTKIGRG